LIFLFLFYQEKKIKETLTGYNVEKQGLRNYLAE